MRELVYKMSLRNERDVVKARQLARHMAAVLGLDHPAQIRLGTATSEIARNAFRYAKSGAVEFWIEMDSPQQLIICVNDKGSGIRNLEEIYEGRYESQTGMGKGIIGTRLLMDSFDIQTGPKGTTVCMGSALPRHSRIQKSDLSQIAASVHDREPDDPFDEVERQNQELLKTLAELSVRKSSWPG